MSAKPYYGHCNRCLTKLPGSFSGLCNICQASHTATQLHERQLKEDHHRRQREENDRIVADIQRAAQQTRAARPTYVNTTPVQQTAPAWGPWPWRPPLTPEQKEAVRVYNEKHKWDDLKDGIFGILFFFVIVPPVVYSIICLLWWLFRLAIASIFYTDLMVYWKWIGF